MIDHIRKGAARQHVDYVLVYETGLMSSDKANGLALADLTVVGMSVLSGRNLQVEASASGILLDICNGDPYAAITAFAEKKGLSRAVNPCLRQRELSENAEEAGVLELADDLKGALVRLKETAAPRVLELN